MAEIDEIELRGILKTRTTSKLYFISSGHKKIKILYKNFQSSCKIVRFQNILNFIYFCILCVPCIFVFFFL